MSGRLDFKVLGPLEVAAEAGTPLALGGRRERTLLAYLLLKAHRVVGRDEIVDALWGETPPATAANAVQVAVHGLRKALGDERVATHGTGYRARLEPGELDLDRFERLLERARSEPPAEAATSLRDALALHRGALLADLSHAAFVAEERSRVEELRLQALEERLDADLALGRHAELVGELRALVSAHPYRERLRGQLMLALYRSGRQADALEEYRRARATLADDLGLDPSRELGELHAAILRREAALTPPVEGQRPRSNLPRPLEPLIGRELELAAVAALLRTADARLVTLTGPGGTGKTRLALAAAHEVVDHFDGGVYFIDLAPLQDATLVAPTAAHALGVSDAAPDELEERVERAVAGRPTLVVLDNVEHVLEGAPDVARLLARAPSLRMLATSREPLRVRGEHEFAVPTLRLPAPADTGDLAALSKIEAVELFLARARSAQPGVALTQGNAGAIVGICRALDGLPLALELAAARVTLLSPDALLERLSDRLAVLTGGDRDLPERQRTLRAAIDWSYSLLDDRERELFARLAVFVGGWTLDAAEDVAGADLGTLGSLVDKSLVRTETGEGAPRFSMLETVRAYALERFLDSENLEPTRLRHAERYARVAERLEPDLHTARALDEAEGEHDNVRAALEHALASGDTALALRLCALARLWYVRGYVGEGRAWIERALAGEGGSPGRRARVLYWSATLAWTSGDHEHAIVRAGESLELARAASDAPAELRALTALGLAHLGAGDLLASRDFHAEALALARSLARDRDIGLSLSNIADLEVVLGDYAQAEALAREALEISRALGDVEGAGVALLVLAASLLEQERGQEAVPIIVESVECFRSVDFKDFLASALVALARARTGADPAHAARLLGAAEALRAPLGPAQFPWEHDWFESTLQRVTEALGAPEAEAEVEAGAREPQHVIDAALAATS